MYVHNAVLSIASREISADVDVQLCLGALGGSRLAYPSPTAIEQSQKMLQIVIDTCLGRLAFRPECMCGM